MNTGPEKSKMANAWFRMCQVNKFQERVVSSRNYELARKVFSDHNPFKSSEVIELVKDRMINNNPMKNPEVAKKVSISKKGQNTGINNTFYNKTHSDKSKKKMSESHSCRPPMSDELKKQIQNSLLGIIWFNDGINNIKACPADERLSDPKWVRGRINNCNLGRPKK